MWSRVQEIDHTPIPPYSEHRSISIETAFGNDSMDLKKMKATSAALNKKQAHKLRERNRLTSNMSVKIYFSIFGTESKKRKSVILLAIKN
jgi:DNA polymerase-4